MYISVHFLKCHSCCFLCAGRRRGLGAPRISQHTSRGNNQVRSKNLEFQPCFVIKFLFLQKSKFNLGFEFKKTCIRIQVRVQILRQWQIGQKNKKTKLVLGSKDGA